MPRISLSLKSLSYLLLLATFVALPSFLTADTFDNQADWEAAICGDVVNDELDYGQTEDSFGLPLDLTLPTDWGMFDYSTSGFSGNNGFSFGTDTGIAISEPAATFIVDPTLGDIEGVSIGYAGGEGTLCVELADGTVITETAPATGDTTRAFFGWTNTTGQAVTDVSFKAADLDPNASDAVFIYAIGFSFGECDTTTTCQDLLQNVIDELYVKLDLASPCDQWWIEEAIYELECAQNPCLWETEDRLSNLGCYFFGNNFYATYYLECVSDSDLVVDCLIGIQELLGCVVESEIAYALENPNASSNLLLYAEYFEEYADAFADAELYLDAVILHFYAWLFANNA